MPDFDFGTIIYLIIIILATVLGGKKRKKTSAQGSSSQSSKKTGRSLLDELLKELQVQPEVFTAPEASTAQHPYTRPARTKPASDTIYQESVENNFPSYPVIDKVDDDYFERRKDYFESNKITMNFDAIMEGGVAAAKPGAMRTPVYKKAKPKLKLKEAFVYSEILNRKQW